MTNPLTELETALAHLRRSPEPLDARLEELKQQYETVLTLLESHFVGALVSGNWDEFDEFVNDFRVDQDVEVEPNKDPLTELWAIAFPKASTDSLTRSGADSCSSANNQLEKD